jgi:Mrp family chromosome partitioning ATPase
MLEKLAKIFEMIVIDSPPVQLVSDALVLSNLSSEVIYVVKADDTPYPLARQGIRRLQRVNAPILGVVLNQLDPVKADRYYGEYSGYGKRYYSKKYSYGYTPKKE